MAVTFVVRPCRMVGFSAGAPRFDPTRKKVRLHPARYHCFALPSSSRVKALLRQSRLPRRRQDTLDGEESQALTEDTRGAHAEEQHSDPKVALAFKVSWVVRLRVSSHPLHDNSSTAQTCSSCLFPVIPSIMFPVSLNHSQVNIGLLLAKLVAFLATGSMSVLAALADSAVDVASQVVIAIAEYLMTRASDSYPVGRSRLEALGCEAPSPCTHSLPLHSSFSTAAPAAPSPPLPPQRRNTAVTPPHALAPSPS